MENSGKRTPGIRAIAIVNGIGAFLTVAFWTLGYLKLFAGRTITDPTERASAAATLGFLVGDVVWAVPLLALSVPGLWRRRAWGWLLAQMANALWAYSMTVIWVRDLTSGQVSPGALLFTPFALFAAWATVYLWRVRDRFWAEEGRGEGTPGARGET